MDFSNYKFHCSSLHALMTNPRNKSEKLSETTKKYLDDIFVQEVYKRPINLENKFLEKGTTVEEDSFSLLTRVVDRLFIKNTKEFSNEWVIGTPDIDIPMIIDIKSAWDIFTFKHVTEISDAYRGQLMGYMWLKQAQNAKLAYCLVNTPEKLIYDEIRRHTFYKGIMDTDPLYEEIAGDITKRLTYDDIPEIDRVKVFELNYDAEYIELLKERVFYAREYLNSCKL